MDSSRAAISTNEYPEPSKEPSCDNHSAAAPKWRRDVVVCWAPWRGPSEQFGGPRVAIHNQGDQNPIW